MGTLRHFPDRHEALRRYREHECDPGECIRTPACKGYCMNAHAVIAAQNNPIPEVPIVFDQLDKKNGDTVFWIVLSVALAISAICIGYGIAAILDLFWNAK